MHYCSGTSIAYSSRWKCLYCTTYEPAIEQTEFAAVNMADSHVPALAMLVPAGRRAAIKPAGRRAAIKPDFQAGLHAAIKPAGRRAAIKPAGLRAAIIPSSPSSRCCAIHVSVGQ